MKPKHKINENRTDRRRDARANGKANAKGKADAKANTGTAAGTSAANAARTARKSIAKPAMMALAAVLVMAAVLIPMMSTDESSRQSGGMLGAQGDITWAHNFGGSGTDYFHGVTATSDGGGAAAGYAYSAFSGPGYTIGNAGGTDGIVFRTDASGNVLWARNSGLSGNDMYYGAAQLSDGGIVAVGYTSTTSSTYGWSVGNYGGTDAIVVKYDTSGMYHGRKISAAAVMNNSAA